MVQKDPEYLQSVLEVLVPPVPKCLQLYHLHAYLHYTLVVPYLFLLTNSLPLTCPHHTSDSLHAA